MIRHDGPTGATVFDPSLKANIHGVMAFTLWFGVLAFTLLYVVLLDRRYRLAALEEGQDDRELDRAIAERVAGAGTPAPRGIAPAVESPAGASR